jgi:hypothetical protein
MKSIIAAAVVALAPIAGGSATAAQRPTPQPSLRAAVRPHIVDREAHLASLREKARQRADQDSRQFSAAELADIEATYQSTRLNGTPLLDRGARHRLEALIEKYPRSNRAGCAFVELAMTSDGADRERYLKSAIAGHDDAWFENGAQVGPLARALLAMFYAGLDRFDDGERVAGEISARYPGSIDLSGASLDDVLPGLKLLRSPK